MTLRLKMVVNSVKRSASSSGDIESEEIGLNAVYGPDGSVNAQWSKWTPCGTLGFTVNNQHAFNQVLPGQFYFIDLTPTTKDG